jgi:ADP-L-glycero-D-manno-heptose 6-epimerase
VILVTGGAGFIGSNLITELNKKGLFDILVVDNLTYGEKSLNLSRCCIADYEDKDRFFTELDHFMNAKTSYCGKLERISQVFHLGACSNTTEWDGKYMMDTNFRASRLLLEFCDKREIPLVYASSAAVYGSGSGTFDEAVGNESPLNVYGYSKLAFDQHVRAREIRRAKSNSTVIGLRYFNVYGPNEGHKGSMASVIYHLNKQLSSSDTVKLFAGSHGYASGEQRRDFVHVDDVVNLTIWAGGQPSSSSGIYNCGTGIAETFNTVGNVVVGFHGRGRIEYVQFPPELLPAYQANTKANMNRLREIGYVNSFKDVESGAEEYLTWLNL